MPLRIAVLAILLTYRQNENEATVIIHLARLYVKQGKQYRVITPYDYLTCDFSAFVFQYYGIIPGSHHDSPSPLDDIERATAISHSPSTQSTAPRSCVIGFFEFIRQC